METPPKASKKSLFSRDAEKILLGCSLSNNDILHLVASELEEIDFFFPEHQCLLRVLKEFYLNDRPVDTQLVIEALKKKNLLADVGGMAMLADLAHLSGLTPYTEEYIRIVKDKSTLRKMIRAAQKVEKEAREEPDDVHSALDRAQHLFFQISQKVHARDGLALSAFLQGKHPSSPQPFLEILEKRQGDFLSKGPDHSRVTGLPTQFYDLDHMINGLNPAHLIILAGRPGMGKTALGLNMLENVCFHQKKPVGIFSLEMPTEQLIHRIIASQAEISLSKILQGDLTGAEFQRIVSCVKTIENAQMIIDDQPNINISNLRTRARRMKEKFNIELLMVDYLQLLDGPKTSRYAESRQNEISEISRMMKNLARELHIPLLCLAQLSRKVEERPGHRPIMSDLRESGCLAGETRISLENTTLPLCDVVSQGTRTWTCQTPLDNPSLTLGRVSQHWNNGKRALFLLQTESGRSIRATANHRFLQQQGWSRLDALSIGEQVACIRKGQEVVWDRILRIQPDGEDFVFDLTVTPWHNFIANDFVVHNSIEQDADIILFLLRREYYDPNDRPGSAEVIVAKNRYGITGQVELAYRARLAQFANLFRDEASSQPGETGKHPSPKKFQDFSPS
ncbi:replicative DNA helicase [Candidatus Similichlamydia laticola]|uniref:Replicative DNA helicase n=1 Tax=Candidatus Similichlamydia laticola TaxID=2170265 RepID=A0A369KGB1_9BACT|nr:replicative DNA helicase [Candidatus Similichlamydia laticola]RDB31745.1 Replicative DNA helicase [Candidatus Similichlamydia laticola]